MQLRKPDGGPVTSEIGQAGTGLRRPYQTTDCIPASVQKVCL